MGNKFRLVIILLFVGLIVLYFFTSAGNTPFNHFTLLANAFLKGKFFIEANAPWLEKVPIGGDKFYVVNPPMPALLLMPFVTIFGKEFPQQLLAHILGTGLSLVTAMLAFRLKRDMKLAIWSGLLTGIGTIIWFLSSVGSTWYLGQITAAFFLSLAILESFGKKRPFLLGLFLGATYLSRIHIALVFPFFIILNWDKLKYLKNLFYFILPITLFVGFDFFYNFARYGTIFNKGYFLIPGTSTEPWFSKGIMHPSYIIEDLKIAFLKLPIKISTFPYIIPSWAGMAIWLTTPAFIFSLKAKFSELWVKYSWLSIFIIFLIVGAHGGTGFAQFGYRFAVDFYPFLTLLTIKGVIAQNGPKKIHWIFLIIGIIVNFWGVIWINKFGWVGW
jgi:hypothetical protein